MDKKYYWLALAAITFVAALLRFWNLGDPQQLVFDEVYFPNYGFAYLTGGTFFDTHPPLSKYLIAIGIWIHNHLPWVTDAAYDTVPLEQLSAWSWRWLNALTGTVLCLVVARLSLYLHPSKVLSLVIAAFIATDGTFVVESRYGLNNIYIVFFGACAMLFLARAFQKLEQKRSSLILCGLFLGFSYSIKWNGLGFSLAAWAILIAPPVLFFINKFASDPALDILQHEQARLFSKIKVWEYGLYLFVLPFVLHVLLWQPHLMMIDQYDFFEMQKQIFGYHSNTVKADEHPYCSNWTSWPLTLRPIGYLFVADNQSANKAEHLFTDVHLLGNPILFWLSAAATLALSVVWILNLLRWFRSGKAPKGLLFQSVVLMGFYANWLPWSLVSRCLFQYHYMAASLFAFLSLAWFVALALCSKILTVRIIGWVVVALLVAGFIFWLPLQLGIPIHPDSFYDRMWLKSWI